METQTIIYKQPYEYKIDIVEKTNAKQELTPEVCISLSRKFEDSTQLIIVLEDDLNNIVEKAKKALAKLKEL